MDSVKWKKDWRDMLNRVALAGKFKQENNNYFIILRVFIVPKSTSSENHYILNLQHDNYVFIS
jgi:hypothetical protein